MVELPVMATAKRYCEFVTHLKAQGARLCELQVMRIRRLTPADKTRLRRNESQVGFVT